MNPKTLSILSVVVAVFWLWVSSYFVPDMTEREMYFAMAGLAFAAFFTTLIWFLDRRALINELDRANADMYDMGTKIAEWEDDHTIPLTREIVRRILENATAYKWTLQGFGMLRLKLGRYGRIHVWDPRFKFVGASEIHDHFWPLKSRIISGRVVNHRYSVVESPTTPTHLCHVIVTGEGGGPTAEPVEVALVEESAHEYGPGEFYEQAPTDIHMTEPDPGTVTLMARPMGRPGDVERARSFFPIGTEWGSAEPREATDEEVRDITEYALRHWRV